MIRPNRHCGVPGAVAAMRSALEKRWGSSSLAKARYCRRKIGISRVPSRQRRISTRSSGHELFTAGGQLGTVGAGADECSLERDTLESDRRFF